MAWRWRNRNRWSDRDCNWGPFTYARDRGGYRTLAVVVQSRGDDDDEGGDCTLRLSGFGHTLISTIPPIVRPWRRKVYPQSWDAETVKRLGRDWYWDTHARQYGFSLGSSGGVGEAAFLQVYLGRQTHDSSTTQQWSKFLPWTDWRHVRRTLYDLNGSPFWSEAEFRARRPSPREERIAESMARMDAMQKAERACPAATFAFLDFDGEELTARTLIEEREWRAGTGWFRWLAVLRKPIIRRSLDISFSGETGRRKGSWKGGTLGHGITMQPGEMHEAAFRRYCAENRMTFIGRAAAPTTTEVGHG